MNIIRAGTFIGRPSSICSDDQKHQKEPVLRRSDVLIDKQEEKLQELKKELEKSLLLLKHAYGEAEEKNFRKKVSIVKKEYDQSKIILQVVLKLNAELKHARNDLEKAFKSSGDIDLARKRVVWLESRIKHILEPNLRSRQISGKTNKLILNSDLSKQDLENFDEMAISFNQRNVLPSPSSIADCQDNIDNDNSNLDILAKKNVKGLSEKSDDSKNAVPPESAFMTEVSSDLMKYSELAHSAVSSSPMDVRRNNNNSSEIQLSPTFSTKIPSSSKLLPCRSSRFLAQHKKAVPVVRLNRKEKFPRSSCNFSDSVPNVEFPAVRLVDQRRLMEETKFSSTLFHSNRGNYIRPISVESYFRGLIAKDKKLKPFVLCNSSRGVSRTLSSKIRMTDQQKAELVSAKAQRIEEIRITNLKSCVGHERADAARALGVLSSSEDEVIDALQVAMKTDSDDRVRYEATRSLILLGCWNEGVLDNMVNYLTSGSRQLRSDLLQAMITGSQQPDCLYQDLKIYSELICILHGLCESNDVSDLVSLRAALCLSYLTVVDEEAIKKLWKVLDSSKDPHIRAQALSALIFLNEEVTEKLLDKILDQLKYSSVWKHRKDAARHLTDMGLKDKLNNIIYDKIYQHLKKALWDDVNDEVRTEAGKALTACGLMHRACNEVKRELEDASEAVRAQAVMSVSTLRLKDGKILRTLLNLIQLDPSQTVQQTVIRTFVALKYCDREVLSILKHKSSMNGQIARDAQNAFDFLSKL